MDSESSLCFSFAINPDKKTVNLNFELCGFRVDGHIFLVHNHVFRVVFTFLTFEM